jgi:hypothetical protein
MRNKRVRSRSIFFRPQGAYRGIWPFPQGAGRTKEQARWRVYFTSSPKHPFPAIGAEPFRFGPQLFLNQAVERGRALQIAAIILLEKIADDDAAAGSIGVLSSDKEGAAAVIQARLWADAAGNSAYAL